MSEEMAEYQAKEFINPTTFHARTCRCDACVEYWGWQQVEPDQVSVPDAPIEGVQTYQEQKKEPGKKWDQGKPRYDLLPPDVLEEIVKIFTDGAEKYGAHNWEKGMSWSRPFAAAQRHMWAFWDRQNIDPESKSPHLAHAIVNLFFLLAYQARGIGTDDRRAAGE